MKLPAAERSSDRAKAIMSPRGIVDEKHIERNLVGLSDRRFVNLIVPVCVSKQASKQVLACFPFVNKPPPSVTHHGVNVNVYLNVDFSMISALFIYFL